MQIHTYTYTQIHYKLLFPQNRFIEPYNDNKKDSNGEKRRRAYIPLTPL